jgi:hypothetical protein
VKENSGEPRVRAISTYTRRGRGEDANLEIISPTSTNISTTIEQSNIYRGFHRNTHATYVSCFLDFLLGYFFSSSSFSSSCSRWLDVLLSIQTEQGRGGTRFHFLQLRVHRPVADIRSRSARVHSGLFEIIFRCVYFSPSRSDPTVTHSVT